VVLVAVAGLWSVAVLWHAPAAFAASVYPYADVPCVWAPYDTAGLSVRWCSDYDWGYIRNDLSAASVMSPYGYYYRNCTDYTAWIVSTLGVGPAQYKGLGNAKEWATQAPKHGLRADGTPAVGAVAVRTTGKYGHTAYVEAVNPDGTIKVSQYNYHADGNYTEEYGTPTFFGFSVFVHFEDYEIAPAPVVAAVESIAAPEAAIPDVVPQVEPSTVDAAPATAIPIVEASIDLPADLSSDPSSVALAKGEALAKEEVVQQEAPPEDPPATIAPPAQSTVALSSVAPDLHSFSDGGSDEGLAKEEPESDQPQLPTAQLLSEVSSAPIAHEQLAAASLIRHTTPDAPPPAEYWSLVGLTGAVLLKEAPPRPSRRMASNRA